LFLARGKYRSSMANRRNAYAAQQSLLRERLQRGMPPSTLIGAPEGGLSLWLTLPEGARVTDLYYRAVRHGVAFVSGEAFYASNSDLRTLRISFGHIEGDELLQGVDRLCSVVHDLSRPARSQPLILS
jgi:DNA-binding transcriptional MocR family regulator